jgi:hypothetical protein
LFIQQLASDAKKGIPVSKAINLSPSMSGASHCNGVMLYDAVCTSPMMKKYLPDNKVNGCSSYATMVINSLSKSGLEVLLLRIDTLKSKLRIENQGAKVAENTMEFFKDNSVQ